MFEWFKVLTLLNCNENPVQPFYYLGTFKRLVKFQGPNITMSYAEEWNLQGVLRDIRATLTRHKVTLHGKPSRLLGYWWKWKKKKTITRFSIKMNVKEKFQWNWNDVVTKCTYFIWILLFDFDSIFFFFFENNFLLRSNFWTFLFLFLICMIICIVLNCLRNFHHLDTI